MALAIEDVAVTELPVVEGSDPTELHMVWGVINEAGFRNCLPPKGDGE